MEALEFFVPVKGRFVSGDMHTTRKNDHLNQPIAPEKQSYDFGIAFPKAEIRAWIDQTIWPYASQCLAVDPQGIQALQSWWQQMGAKGFLSMKIIDGDLPNARGELSQNTAGCYVFYVTTFGQGETARVPSIVAGPNETQLVQIDIDKIKRGDYCTFAGSYKFNGQSGDRKGFYLNCHTVWLLEEGPAISGGGDPTAAFGGAALSGSFDPSGGAGGAFGAPGMAPAPAAAPGMAPAAVPGSAPMVPTQPPAPGGAPMVPVNTPAPGGAPSSVPPGTVSPGNPAVPATGHPPHAAVLTPPVPGT